MEGIEIISKLTLPIAGAVIGLFIGLYSIFKDTAENNWRKQFRKQVRLGVIKNTLNHEDMMHIAERWFQDRKAILHSLRVMHSEAVSGEDTELAQNAQCIRELIKNHQDKEPYAELPENISIQLNDISSQSGDLSITIAQLASSLSELSIQYQSTKAEPPSEANLLRRHNWNYRYTYWPCWLIPCVCE